MFKSSLIVSIAFLAALCNGQDIVSAFSQSGTLTSSTSAGHYVYTRGGSPRSGFYWYWRHYVDQTTQSQAPIPTNGGAFQSSLGTFYSPNYLAGTGAKNLFANSPTAADFNLYLSGTTKFMPALGLHQDARATTYAIESSTFTITQPCLVSVTSTGDYGTTHMVDMATGGTIFGGGGPVHWADTLDPGTYFVEIVFNYSAAQDTQADTSSNLGGTQTSAGVHVHITPDGGRRLW